MAGQQSHTTQSHLQDNIGQSAACTIVKTSLKIFVAAWTLRVVLFHL